MAMSNTDDRKARIAALLAQALEEEAAADAAVSPEDAEEAAAVERIEAARRRKEDALAVVRRARLAQKTADLRKAANGAYVVEPFDANETAPGAGCYVVRSVATKVWQTFQEAVTQAGESTEKVQRAYLNLAGACILWSDAPEDPEAWAAHRAKYPVLVQSIGDMCGRLGGVAATARKR